VRLLYLNHNVVGTGTYLRALHLGRAMVRRGHAVTLVTTSRDNRFRVAAREEDGVRVIEAPDLLWGPARTGWDPWNTLCRLAHLRNVTFDLVHAFDGRPVVSIPGWLLSRRLRAPLIMDWADWWGRGGHIQERSGWPVRTFFGPIETWFEEGFRPFAVGHTVISTSLRERAMRLGLDAARTRVVPNGCPSDVVEPMDRGAARRTLGLDPEEPLAVHVGRMTPVDMRFLADALRALRTRVPAARLVLVGRPAAAVPQDLLAAGAVTVTGYIDGGTKDCWLGAADLCVVAMPDTVGNRGRWPSKINDYLSAGRATVITDVGDAAALVRERGLGQVTAATPTAFSDGMRRALQAPADSVAAGARARCVAETDLAWPGLAKGVEDLYLLALASRADASHSRLVATGQGQPLA
jgi:glycosyltransferase involved in cell wall biosynthesis